MKDLRPGDLAAMVVSDLLAKTPALNPADIDDFMLGCGLPGGEQGFNLARTVAIQLGFDQLPATTLTRYCASSLQATRMAMHAILASEGDVFISAGVECVSRYSQGNSDSWPDTMNPLYARTQVRTLSMAGENTPWHDPRNEGALPDIYIAMGQTAENVATIRGVSRRVQDEFGVRSQNLAEKAIADGFWEREITPIALPDGTLARHDDGPRPGDTYDGVAALKPVFRPKGTVTAGNCCSLNDGAAALLVMSDVKARQLGIEPMAKILATGVSALSPEIMGLGLVAASRRALSRVGMTINDLDLAEINEAFAAQLIPSYRDLDIDIDRLNVHGGAIAVGHPFGMTGARLTGTLINGLVFEDKHVGLVTRCVGGGQGMAMILERLT